ncbi:MAG: MFS transporter, partial [Actinomycetota bacterium]
FSVVLAAVGVGGFVGALLVPAVARRVGRPGVAPLAFALAGVATLIGGPLSVWAAILAAVGLAGTAMTATKIASDTIIMRSIEDHYRGRAFAVYDIGYNGAFVVAALVATMLRPALSDLGIILLAGLLYLAVGGLLALRRRRLPPDVEVRTYAGARADEVPREVLLDGVPLAVAEMERAWSERRGPESLRCFRLRLAGGRRIQVSFGETWRLDRELARKP